MITKNFRSMLQVLSIGTGSTITNGFKTIDGTLVGAYVGSGSTIPFYNSSRELFVGTNGALPSKDDYTIETTNLTKVSTATMPTSSGNAQNYETNTHGSYTTTTFTNNTQEPITIREVGLVCKVGSSSPYSQCLFAREVIEPVTIQPNETYSFTMKFE